MQAPPASDAQDGPVAAIYEHASREIEGEAVVQPGRWGQVKGGLKWAGSRLWDGIEYMGESLVEMMGFNDSRYQWAIDEHFKQKELEEEAQRQEQETDRELQSSSAA